MPTLIRLHLWICLNLFILDCVIYNMKPLSFSEFLLGKTISQGSDQRVCTNVRALENHFTNAPVNDFMNTFV